MAINRIGISLAVVVLSPIYSRFCFDVEGRVTSAVIGVKEYTKAQTGKLIGYVPPPLPTPEPSPLPDLESFLEATCPIYGVSIPLAKAMRKVESNDGKNPISKAGAVGEMQLMESTAKSECGLSSIERIDPYKNITCGCKYMGKLLAAYKNTKNALRHYNGGSNCAKNKNCPESEAYVIKVTEKAISII